MEARLLAPSDLDSGGLDKLINDNRQSDVRLDRDRIVVAGPLGAPSGCLVWRPCALVHELRCGSSLIARKLAAKMYDAAARDFLSQRFALRSVLFQTHHVNMRMQSFAEAVGAVAQESNQILYKMEFPCG